MGFKRCGQRTLGREKTVEEPAKVGSKMGDRSDLKEGVFSAGRKKSLDLVCVMLMQTDIPVQHRTLRTGKKVEEQEKFGFKKNDKYDMAMGEPSGGRKQQMGYELERMGFKKRDKLDMTLGKRSGGWKMKKDLVRTMLLEMAILVKEVEQQWEKLSKGERVEELVMAGFKNGDQHDMAVGETSGGRRLRRSLVRAMITKTDSLEKEMKLGLLHAMPMETYLQLKDEYTGHLDKYYVDMLERKGRRLVRQYGTLSKERMVEPCLEKIQARQQMLSGRWTPTMRWNGHQESGRRH